MTGAPNQIELAQQIKSRATAEFDRVAEAFRRVALIQTGQDRLDTLAIVEILEEKRAEVMATPSAGYFIHDWSEPDGQVRQMIGRDVRYQAIQKSRTLRHGNGSRVTVEGPKQ